MLARACNYNNRKAETGMLPQIRRQPQQHSESPLHKAQTKTQQMTRIPETTRVMFSDLKRNFQELLWRTELNWLTGAWHIRELVEKVTVTNLSKECE